MRRLGRLAQDTPASRERYIDLLRAVAIVLVVLGHWLVTVIGREADGRLTGHSALPDLPWAQPVTWLVQVLPVFFLVGGYANAASLTSAYRRGRDATGWLLDRAGRLVRPTTVLLLALAAASAATRALGAPAVEVRAAAWFATVPLWFLAGYLAVVALTPVMYTLHRRYGLAVPVALVALVAAGDLGRLSGPEALATGNFLFGWLAIHQVGFAWRDRTAGQPTGPGPASGTMAGRWSTALPMGLRAAGALLVTGLVALVALTWWGPYPVSMINIPGERLHNMSPPSLALLALATAQLGLILLLREPAERWLHRHRPWRVVVAVNAVIMTIFLWHVTAAILVAGGLDAAGLLPTPTVGTAGWWLWRLPWLALLTVVLAGLVAIFGRFEWRSTRRSAAGRRSHHPDQLGRAAGPLGSAAGRLTRGAVVGPLTVVGYTALILGLIVNSATPRDRPEPLGLPLAALAAYLIGAALLRTLRAGRPVPATTPGPAA
nr:acyltransferase [Micromonospora sp. DSM 115978]